MNGPGAGTRSHKGDRFGIPFEAVDILLYPLEGQYYVFNAVVAGRGLIRGAKKS